MGLDRQASAYALPRHEVRPLPTIRPVLPSQASWSLHDAAASRRIERDALVAQPGNPLMERAGLAVARLARAVAPHARSAWIAAGPGNNGGDGLVAARHLHDAGWKVVVTLLADPGALPGDAAQALQRATQSGVRIESSPPDSMGQEVGIDALLGLGASRPPTGAIASAIERLNRSTVPVIAVDLPSGLSADSGRVLGEAAVRATHTLSLLTLKPGLFTAEGRDHAGRVWLDTLGIEGMAAPASAQLVGPPAVWPRRHAQHKGSFGDVIVVGGAPGMGGAAMLAARAALAAGAGRVLVARLDGTQQPDAVRPELMPRALADVLSPSVLSQASVVCGCGGGDAVRAILPAVLHHARQLVIDADALNAIAAEPPLRAALQARSGRTLPTIATPHPLEAARLLGAERGAVQADRLTHATMLAGDLRCCVVLKGSGTVIAAPGRLPQLNPTGSARLGSAGTGDVLAGWIGGLWAQQRDMPADEVAAVAAWLHGRAADGGGTSPLLAADLIDAMAALRERG